MAAILAYASVYFMSWMITKNPGVRWVTLIAYPVYFLGALYPSYLLSSRVGHAHLAVGIKIAVMSWLFSGFSLWVLTGTTSFIYLILLLISFFLGGFAGAFIALKRQIRKEALRELEESTNTL
jgi:hypothetical protein